MRVAWDSAPGSCVELETLDCREMVWVTLPDLSTVGDDELRRAHSYVLGKTFRCNGLARMALGTRVLTPLADEMRRRGLKALFWSDEIRERSNAALHAAWN